MQRNTNGYRVAGFEVLRLEANVRSRMIERRNRSGFQLKMVDIHCLLARRAAVIFVTRWKKNVNKS